MNIINKKQTLLSSLILKLFLFLFLFSYNCCQTLLSANENQNNLSKEHASHISFLKFKYNLLPEELKKLIVIIDVEPYHIYQDQEGNVIREYKFFHDMQKNKKDINYKTNFFPIKSFQEKVSKLNNNYPIIWTNGKENLSNFQKDIKENLIYKDLFPISKSDYYFIQTDEPQADLSLLLNDRDIENKQEIIKFNNETYGVYFNKNNSVLNQTDPIDLNDLIINNDVQYRTPYIRLLTKNLELEFNYLALISKNFSNYLNENIVNNIENIFKAEKSIDTYKKYHRILQEMKKRNKKYIEIEKKLKNQLKEAKNYLIKAQEAYDNIGDNEPKCHAEIKYNDNLPYIHYDYNIEQYLDHLKNLKIKKTNNLYNLRMNIIFNITGKIFHPSAKSPDILKRKLLTHVFKFH